MRSVGLAVITTLLTGLPVWSQSSPQGSGSRLDVNQTLFAILAAANLSGYDAGEGSPSNSPLRDKVRERLGKQKITSLAAVKAILRDNRPKDSASELFRYVEFAILSSGPPDFTPARVDLPRPPSVAPLDELPTFLAAFYKEAHLAELWKELQPEYDSFLDKFGPPISQSVQSADTYLHGNTTMYLGQRFLVWAEPLGVPNQVMSFHYMDDYNVVVTSALQIPAGDIRHEYLHYLLDPITNKYSAEIQKMSVLYDTALNAPLVAETYSRGQWVDLATECLIKAVESRIDRKPALADQALKEGYILTPAFVEQLMVFERQETGLKTYFPDMLENIDVKHEQKRLANVKFVTERAVRTVHVQPPPAPPPPPLTGAAKTLDDAEKAFTEHVADRKMDSAKELFLRVLQETDQNPLHAKAYYGLARAALAENDPDAAERLFHKALDLDPDVGVKSWCLLYLAWLSDNMAGGREQALEFYKAALAVTGAPEQVRKAAEQGLNQAFTNKK